MHIVFFELLAKISHQVNPITFLFRCKLLII